METTKDISILSLLLFLFLLSIPIAIGYFYKLKINKDTIFSVARMFLQLFGIGIILKFLFEKENTVYTLLWLLVMITMAAFSIVKNSELEMKKLILPVFYSVFGGTIAILLYFNKFVIGIDNIFDAKYVITIGGMILGNSLKNNIVSLSSFYKTVNKNENEYLYKLSFGATLTEATKNYIRDSLKMALKPSIATMATVGIVSLPGMMTGQMLGGSNPMIAIKYQIAIMVAIYISTAITSYLGIVFSMTKCFDEYGILDKSIFKKS